MRKIDEITLADSCLNKAAADEVIFVLRSKDLAAPDVIRHWCKLRVKYGMNEPNDPKIIQALACADAMEKQLDEA